jgi:hypothetical protein
VIGGSPSAPAEDRRQSSPPPPPPGPPGVSTRKGGATCELESPHKIRAQNPNLSSANPLLGVTPLASFSLAARPVGFRLVRRRLGPGFGRETRGIRAARCPDPRKAESAVSGAITGRQRLYTPSRKPTKCLSIPGIVI